MSTYKDSLFGAIRKLCTQMNGKFAKKSDVPTKVSQLTNDSGYLTQHQSLDGYVKTSEQNTWRAQQTFNLATLGYEQYSAPYRSTSSVSPSTSAASYYATGAFTLNLATLSVAISQQCLQLTSLPAVIMRCPSPTAARLNISVLLPT